MKTNKSFLISIEGIEGCGKSTLIEQLKNKLPAMYTERVFHFFREPGATPWGEKIRSLLLDASLKRSTLSEVFLFISARSELNQQYLQPLLKQSNNVIILDRYFDSTYAYQGFVQGLDLTYLKSLHQTPGLDLVPRQTLYLKISAETSLKRQKKRNQTKDYFEQWGQDRMQQLVHGFDTLAQESPHRFSIIDAEQSEEIVLEQSLNIIKSLMS